MAENAGNTATISVAGPVVNEAQTLNAYWHSHWVQETGMFSSDKRHDIWACGSAAECTALYGSAYTNVGGTIDPPQPVGNIAATIQAPNLSISSNGQIENVGNVVGTSVSLTGQRLINGITTANTYTPRVNAPSQVISLSPLTLPGLNLSSARASGTSLTSVAGQASYVDSPVGSSAQAQVSPQVLLAKLPSTLQPSSTLFYYNPQEEDLLLQQAALKETGKASFVDGLTYDSQSTLSVTEQEKAYLYGNALDYAKQNNVQLGQALTQTQVSALDKPMLWYVEQTVPDPSCHATGTASCPTITALMPQVYLPANTSALSAGGNIVGTDVTLNFEGNGSGSILNTGTISASNTLTVNTSTLTNQANQVNVGQIWSSVKGGYIDTTGTVVQPGGFMSAANMDLNVQTLSQIGGALQKLNADGTVDEAGTQQMMAALQQQLGGNFTQMTLTDHLHTDFVKDGGGLPTFVVIAIAVAASIATSGAAAAAMGTTLTTMTLGQSIAVAALSGMARSAASQLASGQGLNFGAILEAGAIGAITAGLTNGITYNGTTGEFGLNDLSQGLNSLPAGTSTLGQLAGISNIGKALGQVTQAGASAATNLPSQLAALGATAVIDAGAQTAIEGGSFLNSLKGAGLSDLAALGAYEIGGEKNALTNAFGEAGGEVAYVGLHSALGCATSAMGGTGCVGGAIGGATGAALSPLLLVAIDPNHDALTTGQTAALSAFATLVGGLSADLAGANAQAGAQAGQNLALNNDAPHWGQTTSQAGTGLLGQQTGANGPSTLNPLSDPAAVACAGGTQSCDMQMLQTMVQARGTNATQALAAMNTAAPYVGGTLGVALLGPEALTAAGLAAAFDYEGDAVSYMAGLSKDPPNFTKSYITGVVGGLTYPFSIAEGALSRMGTAGKIAANGYNALVNGTAAFGSNAITHQDNPGLSAGVAAGATGLGGWAQAALPKPYGGWVNQVIQGLSGPFQSAVQKASGK